jgi:hypothetical protein
MSSQDVHDLCGFEGNPDLYGQGIRAGIYLQAASVALATLFRQTATLDKISYSGGIFQFALTVSILILTATSPDFKAVEAALVVLLGLCSSSQRVALPGAIIPRRPWTLKRIQFWIGDSGLPIFRYIVEMVLLGYSVWFWFRGLDLLPHSDTCTTYAFFFARVDLYGWFRILSQVYIVIVMACHLLVVTGLGLWKMLGEKILGRDELPGAEELSAFLEESALVFGLMRLSLFLFLALSVEFMVRWNSITSVSSVSNIGQLIALLVGLGVFVSVALDWDASASIPTIERFKAVFGRGSREMPRDRAMVEE